MPADAVGKLHGFVRFSAMGSRASLVACNYLVTACSTRMRISGMADLRVGTALFVRIEGVGAAWRGALGDALS
jgi:hypothetical protein